MPLSCLRFPYISPWKSASRDSTSCRFRSAPASTRIEAMKMPIIAMTHETGSQSKEVALQVADRLGVNMACHRAFEQHVAGRLHADGGMVHRLLQGGPGLV